MMKKTTLTIACMALLFFGKTLNAKEISYTVTSENIPLENCYDHPKPKGVADKNFNVSFEIHGQKPIVFKNNDNEGKNEAIGVFKIKGENIEASVDVKNYKETINSKNKDTKYIVKTFETKDHSQRIQIPIAEPETPQEYNLYSAEQDGNINQKSFRLTTQWDEKTCEVIIFTQK